MLSYSESGVEIKFETILLDYFRKYLNGIIDYYIKT